MTRLRPIVLSLAVLVSMGACTAFKEAMTAHVDVVARAGTQELTVGHLAEMMAESEAPLRPDAARALAQIWVNYHLLGYAGAQGDTLGADAEADRGMWSAVAQIKTRRFYEIISEGWDAVDPATLEQRYNEGALLAAQHILLSKPPVGLSPAATDSIRREADRIAATVTAETFERVARERSQDPGSKDRAGSYGVFPPGQMVPEFDAGIRSVPPGGITQVVESQFGYHIIRRHTWDEIKEQFTAEYAGHATQQAESLYFDRVEKAANVQVRSGAAKIVKAMAEDVEAYRDDRTVVATARTGNLTAGRLAQWIAAFPPQSRLREQLVQVPDSMIPMFVLNIMRNELMLRQADSAGIGPDQTETQEIRQAFVGRVSGTMHQLGVAPTQLADSASDTRSRERLAAERVDQYLSALLRNEAEYVEVPEQIVLVLREKYESRLVPAALDRALTEAGRLRAASDSTAAAAERASSVPMPQTAPRP